MCGKEVLAVWLTAKGPTGFLWTPNTPRQRFFIYWHRHMTHMFTDATSSLPIYSVRAISDATSSLPDYSVRAFSDQTSSLPDYSVRALFWQIEIWSGIYTVYFNCKCFTSLYFIYARAIRMPSRDFKIPAGAITILALRASLVIYHIQRALVVRKFACTHALLWRWGWRNFL